VRGGASQDIINMAANETATIEVKSATYGFFMLEVVIENHTI